MQFVSNILIYNFLDKAPLVQLFIVHSGKDDYFHFSEYRVVFGIGSEKVSFFLQFILFLLLFSLFLLLFKGLALFSTIYESYCTILTSF